jgi:hypothetical protein
VKELMEEYESLMDQIEKEKLTDPETISKMTDIGEQIRISEDEQIILEKEKESKCEMLDNNIQGVIKELDLTIDTQLNCQILNEKPYFTAIAVNFDQKPPKETDAFTDTKQCYLQTVELFTQMNINKDDYIFDKVIRNEEIEYFTLPDQRSKISYRSELINYLIKHISTVLKFVRRIQKPSNFFKSTFEQTK